MGGTIHKAIRGKITDLAASIAYNDPAAHLVASAIKSGDGVLTPHGALAVRTGQFTGRSPKDKFIVRDALTKDRVWWDNAAAISPEQFDLLLADAIASYTDKSVYAQELQAGADPRHAMAVTVFTETAWHALFIRNLLIRSGAPQDSAGTVTIVHAPGFKADPQRHGVLSQTAIALDMSRNVVVIAGTSYAGEIKKSVFSLFNFHAPLNDVMPMHCSANIGRGGDTALFFGLSGTGKTTLSNDPDRDLIGDDEHGWTTDGVFNLEGGCYAKTVKLSAAAEPEIYAATRTFGTVLENLVLDPATLEPDFNDISLTENTRAAYPLETLPAIKHDGMGGVPQTVVFLTADAFGVLPPIALLTPEQAVYHFLSGYTAKVAGTERGITEPQATFSACFGAPFMPLHPSVYGALLAERLKASGASTWLLNTGWTGGAYGTGRRIDIAATRRLLSAALSGELDGAAMRIDPTFGFAVPRSVTGIDNALLEPRKNWVSTDAYDVAAERLAGLFLKNFRKFGAEANASAGPVQLAAAE